MKLLKLSEADTGPGSMERYKGKRFDEDHLAYPILGDDGEDATVLKPDGTVLCILLKRKLSAASVKLAYPILRALDVPPSNRSTTVLGKSEHRLRQDGKPGKTIGIRPNDPRMRGMSSAIIGYYDRHVRWPYCRATAFNLDHAERFEQVLPYTREVDAVFRAHSAARYAAQLEVVNRTHPAWVIPGTVFTTITVNRNYAAACHLDAGDLREGFGVMTAFRSGVSDGGGVTYWPAFRVGARIDTGDVCLADVHEWHGVTPVVGVPGRHERVSCVFYYRQKMCRCGAPEAELERAKARKAGQPLYDPQDTSDDRADDGQEEPQ
jgi:hypothetical protein